MNYGDLIKDAFWITLRNRFLWFIGFFVPAARSTSPPTSGSQGSTLRGAPSAWLSGLARWIEDNLVLFLVTVGGLVLTLVLILSTDREPG
jgi:hypothetical protein